MADLQIGARVKLSPSGVMAFDETLSPNHRGTVVRLKQAAPVVKWDHLKASQRIESQYLELVKTREVAPFSLEEAKCLKCSFCEKKRLEVRRLIAGPEPRPAYICDECVSICVEIVAEDAAKREREEVAGEEPTRG